MKCVNRNLIYKYLNLINLSHKLISFFPSTLTWLLDSIHIIYTPVFIDQKHKILWQICVHIKTVVILCPKPKICSYYLFRSYTWIRIKHACWKAWQAKREFYPNSFKRSNVLQKNTNVSRRWLNSQFFLNLFFSNTKRLNNWQL